MKRRILNVGKLQIELEVDQAAALGNDEQPASVDRPAFERRRGLFPERDLHRRRGMAAGYWAVSVVAGSFFVGIGVAGQEWWISALGAGLAVLAGGMAFRALQGSVRARLVWLGVAVGLLALTVGAVVALDGVWRWIVAALGVILAPTIATQITRRAGTEREGAL